MMMKKLRETSRINIQWLIVAFILGVLLDLTGESMAQSALSLEQLPRTFKGVSILMVPPTELQEIRLLMTPDEVKAILNKAGFHRFIKLEDTVAGINYSSLHVRQPQKGFQQFNFYFRGEELYWMRIEYDMNYFSLDFPAYLRELKAKYNEPAKVKSSGNSLPPPLATESVYYTWVDEKTEHTIGYMPPGNDPLGRSHKGNLVWETADKQLAEKNQEDLARVPVDPKIKEIEEQRKRSMETG
jgi:hypothetical protein